MAAQTQKVVGDLGSEEARLVRKTLNALLDAIATATDFATLQANLATTTDLLKVVDTRELPRPRRFPR